MVDSNELKRQNNYDNQKKSGGEQLRKLQNNKNNGAKIA